MRDGVGRLEVDKRRIDLDALIDVETVSAGARSGGVQGTDTFLVHERLESAMSLMPAGTAFVDVPTTASGTALVAGCAQPVSPPSARADIMTARRIIRCRPPPRSARRYRWLRPLPRSARSAG